MVRTCNVPPGATQHSRPSGHAQDMFLSLPRTVGMFPMTNVSFVPLSSPPLPFNRHAIVMQRLCVCGVVSLLFPCMLSVVSGH